MADDPAPRRAIFTAVDPHEIAQRLGETAYGTGNLTLAEQTLTDAEYEVADNTLTKDGDQVGTLRLRSTATTDRANSLQMIQATLGELGIESVIEHTDQLGEMLAECDYDRVQFGWRASPAFIGAPTQYAHSDSTNRDNAFSSSRAGYTAYQGWGVVAGVM